MTIVLTISHNLFLAREERYKLFAGTSINVIGASIPVWVRKGRLPHEAEEVFCEYTIHNNNKPKKVEPAATGHIITIPPISNPYWRALVSDDKWRNMTEEEKTTWYGKHNRPSSNQLLDIQDGGADGYLSFSYQAKVKKITVLHFVEIKPIEILEKSMV
jgi:hypothetical protein